MSEEPDKHDDFKNSVDTDNSKFESRAQEKRSVERLEVKEKKKFQIPRIPWKEFLRSQFGKLVGTAIILALMIWIINLSNEISPIDQNDPNYALNPSGIVSIIGSEKQQLILLSSIVYLGILAFFSKIVFFDHKQDFGIESYKSIKAILFFLLTFSFISLVFILFDVALTNVYLEILPTYLMWEVGESSFDFFYFDWISEGTDRDGYADIRGLIFLTLFAFMLSFPLAMTIVILTRFGRSQLKERKERPRDKYKLKDWLKFFATVPFLFILATIFFVISAFEPAVPVQFIVLLAILIIGFWWGIQLLILLIRGIRTGSFLIYSNAAMAIPIIFLFYVLPGLIWATWDIFVLFTSSGSLDNTIYGQSYDSVAIDPAEVDITTLNTTLLLEFYFQTFLLNLGDLIRIIELDFIFIIGLSSIVIGFAEGYSIVAIVRSISTGVSIARSGRVATRSAPKMVVLSSRLILLLAWMGLLYDKFIVIWNTIAITFNLPIPELSVPRIFEVLFGVTIDLQLLGGIFLGISLLIVPFYFIITSSFKFLSVSIIVQRTKEDTQVFFFLISSAFILIVSQILADISALDQFVSGSGDQYRYLPIQSLASSETDSVLPFINNIFEALEAIGFYVGAIVSFFLLLKLLFLKIIGR